MSGATNNPYLETSRDDLLRIMTAPNAGAHNAVYRGKRLGTEPTEIEYAAIDAGTFDDMYIGDYWDKGGVNYRIAAFNYFLHTGDTECTTNHVVIVPDACLYNAAMNSTNTTDSGYVYTQMIASGIKKANDIIKNAFGERHLMMHRNYLSTGATSGRASTGSWFDDSVTIMCEHMVYGSGIFSPVSDGSTVPNNCRVEKSQLPLFQHEPSWICNRTTWWLRDVVSSADFAYVNATGIADYGNATTVLGVRPYFCIK